MAKESPKGIRKFRDKYAVKIDLRDAIFGGVAIYVTTYLLSIAFIFTAQIISWLGFPDMAPAFAIEQLKDVAITDARVLGFLFAAVAATSLMMFFVLVLFEENFFTKHENGLKDLLGLGLVWGMSVLSIDTIISLIQLPEGGGVVQLIPTIRDLTYVFYLPLVVYIILLPAAIYYLRKDKAL